MLQPQSGKPDFHPSNLANRENIEAALHPGARGATFTQIATVAEMLCQTEAVTLDLAYSSASKRVEQLLKAGFVEVVTLDGRTNLKPYGPVYASLNADVLERNSATARFKLTDQGRDLVEFAKSRPYASLDSLDRVRFEFDRDNDLLKADERLKEVLRSVVSDTLDFELLRGCQSADEMLGVVIAVAPRQLDDVEAIKVERAIRERFLVVEQSVDKVDKFTDVSRDFENGGH